MTTVPNLSRLFLVIMETAFNPNKDGSMYKRIGVKLLIIRSLYREDVEKEIIREYGLTKEEEEKINNHVYNLTYQEINIDGFKYVRRIN